MSRVWLRPNLDHRAVLRVPRMSALAYGYTNPLGRNDGILTHEAEDGLGTTYLIVGHPHGRVLEAHHDTTRLVTYWSGKTLKELAAVAGLPVAAFGRI